MHVFASAEIAAALLQMAVTLGLAGLFVYLHRRYRKPHFLWWGVAWSVYALRLGAIIAFLASNAWSWLYWHQVATGWTALAFLWAALVFSRQLTWRPAYLLLLLFPPLWAWVSIFQLDDFLLAAGSTVVLLSLATAWTGVVFLQYRRRTGSSAAGMLAVTLLLWSLHHLDYPLLRARGAWNPWGYYLDLLFVLAMGGGVLLLVIEELRQGLATLSTLSGDLRRSGGADALDALLRRPLALRGIQGTALVRSTEAGAAVLRGVGQCEPWSAGLPGPIEPLFQAALRSGQPVLRSTQRSGANGAPFTAVLPIERGAAGAGSRTALVIVGEVAAPFAALDDRILEAVGEQIGAALANAELDAALERRTADLERLSIRMIQQHEEQRRRLSRELHDETAQVFASLKLRVGTLREAAPEALRARFDGLLELVGAGTRSIRNVTEVLRPAVLDDLGLVPAIRALISDFREWSGVRVDFEGPGPDRLPAVAAEVELAVFRAVQEGLSNVARHARAGQAVVRLDARDGGITLVVEDDGVGLTTEELARAPTGPGRSGLFGMRERITALGGQVSLEAASIGGFRLAVTVPAEGSEDQPTTPT